IRGAGRPLAGVGARAPDFYLRTGYMPLAHVPMQPRLSRVLFSDAEIRALIAYIASLGPGPPIPTPHPERGNVAAGLHQFTEHCAGCHQVVAEGGYVTDSRVPPLKDVTARQLAEPACGVRRARASRTRDALRRRLRRRLRVQPPRPSDAIPGAVAGPGTRVPRGGVRRRLQAPRRRGADRGGLSAAGTSRGD